jgi:hypothetical protein
MKVAVIGSRTFFDKAKLVEQLDRLQNISLIVSGGARGADSLGEQYAKERKIPTMIFLPDWERFGKSAGFKRNVQIIDHADLVVAFWDGQSAGTRHSIDLARKSGKECKIVLYSV